MPLDQKLTAAIVIPARLESTRLARKLLLDQTGKTLIEHTWIAAAASQTIGRVIVATDSPEIADAVTQFGGEAVLTSLAHSSGTDRVAEVAAGLDVDLIVNLQGDEPEMEGAYLDRLVEIMAANRAAEVATLATPITNRDLLIDPACVKVVFDRRGRALYFSRSPIPTPRDPSFMDGYFGKPFLAQESIFFQHLGVYADRREFLLKISEMTPSRAEVVESLEQLRFLDHGHQIWVDVVAHGSRGIDTAQDYTLFVNRQSNR